MVNDKLVEGKQDGAPENTVSSNVFADREDFGSTLLTAAAGTNDSNALRQFDGQDGGPVIVDDDQRDRVTSLPVDFSAIPEERLKQMNEDATQLIRNYLTEQTPTGGPDLSLSFNNIADIMKDISKMDQYSEVEKCRLWSEVRNLMQERGVHVLDADEKPEMIDSWKGSRDPWHALITLDDGYHANRLINMSPQDASQAIRDHEAGAETKNMPWYRAAIWNTAHLVLGTNTGDINASEGQLHALRALRENGTFASYADEWRRQFVRTDVDQWGSPVR